MSDRATRTLLLLVFLVVPALGAGGCSPPETDGDADADTDADLEVACPPEWSCCQDPECSDGLFCNGIEVCDRGECQPSPPPDCDDGLACTVDACDEAANLCTHTPDHAVCSNGLSCDGDELCDPTEPEAGDDGCVAGRPKVCDDGDDCTDDYCDPGTDDCATTIRDADDDGHGDARCRLCEPDDPTRCEVGDDCDDGRADVYPGAPEVCDDGVDNDCDRAIDLLDSSCMPENDTCASATVLSGPGAYTGSTRGLADDYAASCSAAGELDAVFRFELSDPADVEVRVSGGASAHLALLSSCSPVAEITCGASGFHQFGLAAGTYYVVVDTAGPQDFRLSLEIDPATDPPANDTCAGAVVLTPASTPLSASAYGANDSTDAFCSTGSERDVFFTLELTDPADLTVSATAAGVATTPYVEVRSGCEATGALECGQGEVTVRNLSAGTYTVVVESAGVGSAFTLDYSLSSPTAGAVHAGLRRTCADPLVVSGDAVVLLNTMGAGDRVDLSCTWSSYEDAAFRLDLATPGDLALDLIGGPSSSPACALSTTCASVLDEVVCGSSYPLRARGLAAGTYYVVCDTWTTGLYELGVRLTPPTPSYEVTGNDTCASPWPIGGPGLYRGTTSGLASDYTATCGGSAGSPDAVFRLELAARSRVVLDLAGSSYDTVLHVRSHDCATGAQVACDDDGSTGVTSLVDMTLEAGTYFVFVDGYSSSSSGAYQLLVEII